MKRFLLVAVGVLVLAGLAIGYKMYQQAPKRAEDVQAIDVKAEDLSKAFATNASAAQQQYVGKVLAVSGQVHVVEANQEGKPVVILQTEENPDAIRATLRDADKAPKPGTQVKVKGFCDAYMPGEDVAGIALPGSIVLTDCILTP